GVAAERGAGRQRDVRGHATEPIDLPALPVNHLVGDVGYAHFDVSGIEGLQRAVRLPAQHTFQMDDVAGPVDRLVSVYVADQLARGLAQVPAARIDGGD